MCGALCCHSARWALTPPFHPYHMRGGRFLSHYSAVTDSFPLRNMALCVARTFLLPAKEPASDRTPYCCFCKDSASREKRKELAQFSFPRRSLSYQKIVQAEGRTCPTNFPQESQDYFSLMLSFYYYFHCRYHLH